MSTSETRGTAIGETEVVISAAPMPYVEKARWMLRIAALRSALSSIAAAIHHLPAADRDRAITDYLAVMLDVIMREIERLDGEGRTS